MSPSKNHVLAEADKDFGAIGPCSHLAGGSCCITCRRYIDGQLNNILSANIGRQKRPRKPALPISCCEFCGRTPLDHALLTRGVIAVARELTATPQLAP